MQKMWETQVQPLGLEDPQEEEMETNSRILAWEIPWTEARDIVQEAVIKAIPNKKKCKKAKWLSKEALQIVEQRREVKRKDIRIWMQSSKEYQREIRKPPSWINAKK